MRDNSKLKVIFLREEYADGEGTFEYSNNSKYEGHWKNGKRHGLGIHTLSDESIYVGLHKDGHRHGKGIEIFSFNISL